MRSQARASRGRMILIFSFLTAAPVALVACTGSTVDQLERGSSPQVSPEPSVSPKLMKARKKIKHVVVIMQENRSFDHYFGTFPGADGIPIREGLPVCIPNSRAPEGCTRPWHDARDENQGGPHDLEDALANINGGKMDGFISQWFRNRPPYCSDNPSTLVCHQRSERPGVVGYHEDREMPNYWEYAKSFVLQEKLCTSRPNVCIESWVEPASSPLHGVRVVCRVQSSYCSDELHDAAGLG